MYLYSLIYIVFRGITFIVLHVMIILYSVIYTAMTYTLLIARCKIGVQTNKSSHN